METHFKPVDMSDPQMDAFGTIWLWLLAAIFIPLVVVAALALAHATGLIDESLYYSLKLGLLGAIYPALLTLRSRAFDKFVERRAQKELPVSEEISGALKRTSATAQALLFALFLLPSILMASHITYLYWTGMLGALLLLHGLYLSLVSYHHLGLQVYAALLSSPDMQEIVRKVDEQAQNSGF